MNGSGARTAWFRFYGELDELLRAGAAERERAYRFRGRPAVKDAIEAQGVPHTEVGLILAAGAPVGFGFGLSDGDRVAVFPHFTRLDLGPLATLLRPPLDACRFVLDVNLGKLAAWLRLLGFDTLYRNDFTDAEVAAIAERETRIVLTRDRRLLHQKRIANGHWVRADAPDAQVLEVLRRFRLGDRVRPLSRCLRCNGLIRPAPREQVWHRLEPKTKAFYHRFFQCQACGRVYWQGSHYDGLVAKLRHALATPHDASPA